MCGLIGVVTRDVPDLDPRDPRPLVEEARTLAPQPLIVLEARLEGLEARIQDLFHFASFQACLIEPGRVEAITMLGRSLANLAEACEAEQARATVVETQERLSAANIKAKDLAWRLEQDLLPNLRKVESMAGRRTSLSRNRTFELWKINSLLNGIDRLEVRGRDSAGIVLQVHFPDLATLERFVGREEIRSGLEAREGLIDFVNGAIRRSASLEDGLGLLFVYKVAHEVGEMGENVAALRAQIAGDDLLHAALELDGIRVSPLAHTRWASNGIISEPNCHPLDNECLTVSGQGSFTQRDPAPRRRIIAALNGDIDNYQPLKERLGELDRSIAPSITTDAKIIPLWIDRSLEQGLSMEEAFRKAVSEFQGSMAIGVQSTTEPGRVYLALRGSGQSIYIGVTSSGFLYASELYGLVEETQKFIKMDGEKERVAGDPSSAGQIAILDAGWGTGGAPTLSLSHYDGTPIADTSKLVRRAEITTRDINRAGYEHFMLKEITESVSSVRKTIRGKYVLDETDVRFTFLSELLPPALSERLKTGQIRRIYCVGQGTASVAGQGIAAMMSQLLADAPVEIIATKATELSGFVMRPRMDDTLVIAVSQSGTTTDTNRTVDLVRERGANVIAIVNRRNSDLVYKADSVLYTSDGRDVEMSVASTKAFYAQIAAGCLLTLALAQLYGTISDSALREELHALEHLPILIGRVLQDQSQIQEMAEQFAVRHRHWAVVGNGANKVAADEIRIKLSELCYKAIACDYTEDKKHIDLSSEPLILVCAAGLSSSNLNDVVKEVAIFKAHKARPLVFTQEGESRFDPYAAGVIHVPKGAGRLSFVLTTTVGHLWGYYAARALDRQAQVLRKLRAQSVSLYERLRGVPGGTSYESLTSTLRAELGADIRQIESWLVGGALDSGLTAASAVRLTLMLHAATGRLPFDDLVLELGGAGSVGGEQLFETYLAALTGSIGDLTRPIDAIKHQAKTVTVGISRAAAPTGVVFEALEAQGIEVDALLPSHVQTLQAVGPLIEAVEGSVRYALEDLNAAGEPGPESRIRTVDKTGIAAGLTSRADRGAPLIGSKYLIAMERRLFIGVGSTDGRKLVMFPLIEDGHLTGLMLLHVRFRQMAEVDDRLAAVRNYRNRYERLVGFVTELNMPWQDELLTRVPVELLFEGSPEAIARAVQSSSAA